MTSLYQYGFFVFDVLTGDLYKLEARYEKSLFSHESMNLGGWVPTSIDPALLEKRKSTAFNWQLDVTKRCWVDNVPTGAYPSVHIPTEYWDLVYSTYMINQLNK